MFRGGIAAPARTSPGIAFLDQALPPPSWNAAKRTQGDALALADSVRANIALAGLGKLSRHGMLRALRVDQAMSSQWTWNRLTRSSSVGPRSK